MSEAEFVAVDWGTSSFRLWVIGSDGRVLASTRGSQGMSRLKQDEFGPVLEGYLAELGVGAGIPALVCGMAGAAQGWCEAPYHSAISPLEHIGALAVRVGDAAREVLILPGLRQDDPANVMRGEETQILGFLRSEPGYAGTIALPGTHTKWCRISGGTVLRFDTCMSGEFFALLSDSSVLRHSTRGGGWDDAAFRGAVSQGFNDPGKLATTWFGLRSDMLLGDLHASIATARLSGWLIGWELAATREYWHGTELRLIGERTLCHRYLAAVESLGGQARIVNSETATLAGLKSAWMQIRRKSFDT